MAFLVSSFLLFRGFFCYDLLKNYARFLVHCFLFCMSIVVFLAKKPHFTLPFVGLLIFWRRGARLCALGGELCM
jgi:hypothetical protein